MRKLFLFLLIFINASSVGGAPPPTVSPIASLAIARRSAHDVLMKHCAACHVPYSRNARLGALKIFDLSRGADWSDTMTEANLTSAQLRMQQALAITPEELAAFNQFVGKEFAARRQVKAAAAGASKHDSTQR